MKRILIFVVETQEDGKTIREFLKKCAIFSEKEIRALKFRENGICVNGERKRVTYVLKKGETLELSIEEEEKGSHQMVRLDCALDVLYEDQDIFVVNKPAGILVHPVGGHYEDTLSNMAAAYFEKKGEHVVIRPVGRLDKDTSGAVLFAKNRIAAARLSAPGSGFEKEYFALVQGTFPAEQQSGEIHTPLSQCPGRPLKMCPDFVHGKEAHTFYGGARVSSGLHTAESPDYHRAYPPDSRAYGFHWTSAPWRRALWKSTSAKRPISAHGLACREAKLFTSSESEGSRNNRSVSGRFSEFFHVNFK